MKKVFIMLLTLVLAIPCAVACKASSDSVRVVEGWNGIFTASDTNEIYLDDCDSSSELTDSYGYYSISNCFDLDPRTTWAEDEDGDGSGSYIHGYWVAEIGDWLISGLAIRAGYQKSSDTYYNNNRPRTVWIDIVDPATGEGESFEATLLDTLDGQCILFDDWFHIEGPVEVWMMIEDVYPGSKYDDLCISDFDLIVSASGDRTDMSDSFNSYSTEDYSSESYYDDDDWLEIYQRYIDNYSNYRGYAALADFDLDGNPELMALDDDWPHMGVEGCIVKYDGNRYIVYEDDIALIGVDDQLALTVDSNGIYKWYRLGSYTGMGDTYTSINALTFSDNMEMMETNWLSTVQDYNDEMTEFVMSYFIQGEEVSYEEYRSEEIKWEQLTVLFVLDPSDYKYPDNWYSANSQFE